MSSFPQRRLRRLRRSAALRSMTRETHLAPADLIYPLFVAQRTEDAGGVSSMPGIVRHTIDALDGEIEQIATRGIPSVLLFGIPARKDAAGTSAHAEDGVIPEAVRRIKSVKEDIVVVTDVCLCGYTDHGHCGILHGETVANDETLAVLGRVATAHARAGADIVAPSAMMDGQVAAIRRALDGDGLSHVAILSYAAKYASAFYGPFRDAADCAPRFGDRRSHQMDPGNAREALAEVELDLREGADAVMVKPAMPYLDVVSKIRDAFPQAPLAAYQVSGEYSMIRAAAEHGWLDARATVLESLLAIKRAGATMIITYFAKEAAAWLADR